LLLFGLVVTPSATALALTARPVLVVVLGTALGLASVVVGLVVAVMFDVPPSFAIVSVAFLGWLVVTAITRLRP
jgi:zinc/manganese transport system permease protein